MIQAAVRWRFKCLESLSHREVSCEGRLGAAFGVCSPWILWMSRASGVAAGHEQWTMDHWGILEEDGQMCVYVEEAVENGFFDLVRVLREVEVLRLCFVDRSLVFQWH